MTACTCLAEANGLFPAMCQANYHHWEAMLAMPKDAKIVWIEDGLADPRECFCEACRP